MRLELGPWVRQRVPELRERFAEAQPFRHVIIDGFLDDQLARGLVEDFPPFVAADNEVGRAGGKAVQPSVRELGGAYRELDDLLRRPALLQSLSDVTGIADLLHDPTYFGGGTHENLSGQSLDPHVDLNYHPFEGWHRRLNLILYLNDEWDETWGGCIDLYEQPWIDVEPAARILPLFNRCLLFETNEYSWHGFAEIEPGPDGGDRSRRSFATYFYTRERPVDEIVAPHTTHYVHRPLPDHLRPGHTLDEHDVELIQQAVAQRSEWIRFLYEREIQLSGRVQELSAGHRDGLWKRLRRTRSAQVLAPLGSRRRDVLGRLRRRLDSSTTSG